MERSLHRRTWHTMAWHSTLRHLIRWGILGVLTTTLLPTATAQGLDSVSIPHRKHPTIHPIPVALFEQASRITQIFDRNTIKLLTVVEFRDGTLQAYLQGNVHIIGADSLDRVWNEQIIPIYQLSSMDGGKSWSKPILAIKHNRDTFVRLRILRLPKRLNGGLLAILHTSTGEVMYARSNNEGSQWSYPASTW